MKLRRAGGNSSQMLVHACMPCLDVAWLWVCTGQAKTVTLASARCAAIIPPWPQAIASVRMKINTLPWEKETWHEGPEQQKRGNWGEIERNMRGRWRGRIDEATDDQRHWRGNLSNARRALTSWVIEAKNAQNAKQEPTHKLQWRCQRNVTGQRDHSENSRSWSTKREKQNKRKKRTKNPKKKKKNKQQDKILKIS